MTNQNQTQPLSEEEQAMAAGYVLGDLTREEQQQMAVLLKNRPEMRQEVQALRVSLRSLPQGLTPVAPPPALESKILMAYEATSAPQTQRTQAPAAQSAKTPVRQRTNATNTPKSKAKRQASTSSAAAPKSKIQNPKSKIPWSKLIAGIATLAALGLGASNARLRYQLAQMPSPDADRAVAILQQPTSRLVSLQGMESTNTATAGGTLLFQKGQWQEVVVSLNNLPPLPVEQVYRMWLTLENGEVIFCGEFNTEPDGTILVRLNPADVPPEGVKTTGLFVTQDAVTSPIQPGGTQIMVGEI